MEQRVRSVLMPCQHVMSVVVRQSVRNVNQHIIQLVVNAHCVHPNIVHKIVMYPMANVLDVPQDII